MTKTLFGRTSLIISSTMLAFLLAVITIAGYFIILPVGKRNADDLASLILLSAKTYVELPPETRQDFIDELSTNHQLFWGKGDEKLAEHIHLKPHFSFMEETLSKRLGSNVDIAPQVGNSDRHWVDIQVANETVRIGFDQQRIGVALPYVALYLVSILAIMAVFSSLILVRKITRPVQKLSQAAKVIGSGGVPETLKEEGSKELAETAKAFNKMSADVQNLLENRTVLLGGISHDLRTPLTRMRVALEMLPDNVDDELRNELSNSIGNMEIIIKEYMQLTKGLEEGNIERVNIHALVGDIISEINPSKNQTINLVGADNGDVDTYAVALHRTLFNLIENAVRYGKEKPIDITWSCSDKTAEITISDQGSGIPKQYQEEIFKPFYRIESSRNRDTGGSGLGLAIVDQIVQKRGWQLSLSSDKNTGTSITLSL
jgi:two-component system, OmpR family, osmolarity sensor histidine kinase EnvZ